LLLAAANNAPIVLKLLMGERWDAPLDGGARFLDGRPLLGRSKTIRGFAAGVIGGGVAALLLGFPPILGLEAGALAMAGDALASFAKRRLNLEPGGRATGLDQIPEALLPLVALRQALATPWWLVAAVTTVFLVLEIPLARLAFRLRLRDRPH
jgi:CDP-2,3-bis-(O-geranylgeranyl)-sn-glycerol synthase